MGRGLAFRCDGVMNVPAGFIVCIITDLKVFFGKIAAVKSVNGGGQGTNLTRPKRDHGLLKTNNTQKDPPSQLFLPT